MMARSIEILYKCRCLLREVGVAVPARREGEDVVEWVRVCVMGAVSLDHRMRSPDCLAPALEYVKIPAPENAPFLGAKPALDS